jgi:hypothetical protein
VKDIEGAKAKGPYVRKRTQFDSFNYYDVTRDVFRTTRSVNPLEPSYKVRDDQGNAITIGEIKGSSPRKLPERKRVSEGCFLDSALNLRDIPGTAPGSKRLGAFHSVSRRHFTDPNDISDIHGSQSNTLKRGV